MRYYVSPSQAAVYEIIPLDSFYLITEHSFGSPSSGWASKIYHTYSDAETALGDGYWF